MRYIEYEEGRKVALAISREDAVRLVAELVGQLGGVGGGGSSEYIAICDEDSSKNRYLAFMVDDTPRVPYPPPRDGSSRK